ncbi:MAG: TAXI family TRAP transporter solute-binding subunit [Alphaproteobacteria bacterium]|jgi:TRAP transporter TAXI family solute receptor
MKKIAKYIVASAVSIAFWTSAHAENLGLGTMSQGTLSFTTGTVLAKVLNENTDLEARVQPNSGESVLIPLINSGDLDFGIANVLEAQQASSGTGVFQGKKQDNLRIAAVLFPLRTAFFVHEDSDIKTLADLKGKRVTVGFSAMGTVDAIAKALLHAGGVESSDIKPVMVPNVVVGAEQFLNGRADAFFFAVGAAKVAEVNAAKPVRVLALPDDEASIARLKSQFPDGYGVTVPPLPNFAGVSAPTTVLGYDNTLLTGTHVSDEAIKKVLDGIANNKDALAAAFPLYRGLDPAKMYKEDIATAFHKATVAWAASR